MGDLEDRPLQAETLLVHAGRPGWPRNGGRNGQTTAGRAAGGTAAGIPTSPPIHPSSAFWHDGADDLDRAMGGAEGMFSYGRFGNPTVEALEQALALAEGTEAALAFPSGMAAIHAAIMATGIQPGETLLLSRDVYGATLALSREWLGRMGIHAQVIDATDLDAALSTLRTTRPRALLFETVSNPLLRVADALTLIAAAKEVGTSVVVDNTFATPLSCRPAGWGADFVVHSTTKFLAGHGDVIGGAVCATAARRKDLLQLNKLLGAVASPFDAWLTLRGMRTLGVRFARQEATASELAGWLADQPGVSAVHYPGLATHPDHPVASRILAGPGAMLSAELAGGADAVRRVLEDCRVWVPATTLGDCTSLVLYPVMASHRGLAPEERAELGITDGLVRFSVGLENVDDLKADLARVLRATLA